MAEDVSICIVRFVCILVVCVSCVYLKCVVIADTVMDNCSLSFSIPHARSKANT